MQKNMYGDGMNSFRKESHSGISSRLASLFLTQEILSLVIIRDQEFYISRIFDSLLGFS